MATGHKMFDTCHPTLLDAQSHYFNSLPTHFTDTFGTWYLFNYKYENNAWKIKVYHSANLTPYNTIDAPLPYIGACDYLNDKVTAFNEGLELGWAVAGACAIAWAVRFLRTRH